jgi:hypothetical protein
MSRAETPSTRQGDSAYCLGCGFEVDGGRQVLYIWTAGLKEGKEKQYKAWSLKAIGEYKKRAPQGWKLIGAYGATGGFAKFDVAWIWQFKRWSDWDTMYDLEDKVLDKMTQEENTFLLPGTVRAVAIREMEDWLMPITKKKKK